MDYDVGVTGLSSPPASAVLTQYRPAVSVRNNGIHDAIASGYLRIYSAGLLIFETELYSGTLSPGASGTADATDYWTPSTQGTYIIQGYVSTPLDQVEPNNNLAPVTVIVTGEEPPVPPTVPLHAVQHEEGGTDPINVDGLPGVLTDRQLPSAHAAQHQAGTDDAINVAGLAGILGEPQAPQVHGNAHHSPDMATSDELDAHAGSVAAHTAATNLANRETIGPELGLVPTAQLSLGTAVPDPGFLEADHALRCDRHFGHVNPVHHAFSHAPDAGDPVAIGAAIGPLGALNPPNAASIAVLHIPGTWLIEGAVFVLRASGMVLLYTPMDSISFHLMAGAVSWLSFDIDLPQPDIHFITLEAHVICLPADLYTGDLELRAWGPAGSTHIYRHECKLVAVSRPATDKDFALRAEMAGDPTSYLTITHAFGRSLGSGPAAP